VIFPTLKQNAMIRNLLTWLVPLALVAAIAFVVTRPRPTVTLTTLELTPLNAAAPAVSVGDLRGQVVLVNFWGTWCPPCREEFPYLAALAKQYESRKDFRLLSISSQGGAAEDMPRLKSDTEAFLKRGGYELPVYADPDGATRQGLAAVASPGVFPATFVVDRDGRVVEGWLGYDPATFERIKLQVASLLGAEQK
jgi:thiol-disulfide isomerase/thioredoxin